MKKGKTEFISILTVCILAALFIFPNQAVAESKRKLKIATCNWEPHFGENMPTQGYFSEITKLVFKRAGYNSEIKFMPWKRALYVVENGEYDCAMAAFYTEERERIYKLTDPIAGDEICFFVKKGRNIKYKTLKDLAPYVIAYTSGSHISDEFDTATYLKKEPLADDYLNIKKLMHNRIDIIASSRIGILYRINTTFPQWKGQLEILQPPVKVSNMHNAISRKLPDYEKIADNFNKALKEIRQDGTYDRIMKKHGF